MMGYISDKTLVNGYKWEEIKDQLSFIDFGSDEDLYLALRARQDELGDTSEVLYPTLYDQNTRNRCTIEFKITAIFSGDELPDWGTGAITFVSEC